MAVIVVGGQTRNIGKTSVVAGLIAALPEFHWTAFKVTQYGHGFCTADGKPCQCQTADSCVSVSAERDADGGTDSSRFLAAGAVRSIWVRTRIGMLADAVPRIEQEIARSENAILESNSILEFLRPDLYLSVLEPGSGDFKDSARRYLDRADALLVSTGPQRNASPPELLAPGKPLFTINAPEFISDAVVDFVRERLMARARAGGQSSQETFPAFTAK